MLGRTIRRNVVDCEAPSECAACSTSGSSSSSTGCTVRTTNGSVTNIRQSTTRRLREGDVDVDRRLRPVEREQRQPGDDRRQRERKVDDRVHERLAAEVVADEHPRGDRPQHCVEHRDGERGDERQLESRHRLRAGDGVPEGLRALARRLPHEGGDGQQDENREEQGDKADGQGRCGPVRVRLDAARSGDRGVWRASRCRHRPRSRSSP